MRNLLSRQLQWLFGSRVRDPIALAEAGGLTPGWQSVRLDKVGSVSASEQVEIDWDDDLLNEQYRRFHNGS